MFIEVIDSLRCTSDHAESWLVAAIVLREERFILAGTLGCPVCGREFPIDRGVARFGTPPAAVITSGTGDDASTKLGAFMMVAEGGSYAAAGEWALALPALAQMVPARYLAVNAPSPLGESEHVSSVQTDARLPVAGASLRGIALDVTNASVESVQSAVKSLAPGARILAPASVALPDGTTLLARDDHWWIAERAAPLVPLRRR